MGGTAAAGAAGAPLLGDLMPWGVAPLRTGRSWVMGPDAATLTARWDALVKAEGADREALFRASRSRSVRRPAGQLPRQRTGTGPLEREDGPCPEPVRVLHGAFDEQWLIPDQRLIDVARPELWRVADEAQVFVVELGQVAQAAQGGGPAAVASALLPDGRSPAGRPGRIRPLYRRPGGREPNLAPGLIPYLRLRLGVPVAPEDVLAWVLAQARPHSDGCRVPLTADPAAWAAGIELGHRILDLHLRGAHSGTKPRLPGGRRPYVRASIPARPADFGYGEVEPEPTVGEDAGDAAAEDAATRRGGEGAPAGSASGTGTADPAGDDPGDTAEAAATPAPVPEILRLGTGRISPVPQAAWDYTVGGVRVLEQWLTERIAPPAAEPGSLDALRPHTWPQQWTSELQDLITILTLLAELPEPAEPAELPAPISAYDLRQAAVLPAPRAAQRPASVLDHHEEGPEGQFALV
ncbi:type ISP restriction/modification enzyme [Streptomyces boninensis]|uniref:type ISP restriction/modification enzyme n=1 Tax=Streptomyces boninensis TaxID=2039455 RepID=UPI003B220678